MDFTNDVLKEIKEKKKYNIVYSKYYYRLSFDYKDLPIRQRTILNKHNRVNDCMNLWQWDLYNKNKLMDLQKVNRCMDNRFCPNCRKFNLARAIHNLRPAFSSLLSHGYYPYLLTLTVPNVKGEYLKDTIEKMNKAFSKFNNLLSKEISRKTHGFKERYMKFDGALKVLEITYNKRNNTFHPHFHIMIFSLTYDEELFEKKYHGAYSRKQKQYLKYSDMDYQIMKLWKLCYDGQVVNIKNYNNLKSDWTTLYQCDIKEMNVDGIYEVLKYTFKDSDIENYYVFKTIFLALEGKRIRQGYGLLYSIKFEEESEGELLELELEIKENPEQLLTREIKTLITTYHDYKKISRFKAYKELENIKG